MEQTLPKYSVLMGIYDKVSPNILKESIESVLHQTCPPDEFVIIKDGKLTAEQEVLIAAFVEQFPQIIRIVAFEDNHGQGYIYHHTLPELRNEFVTLMDSDDVAVSTKNEKQLQFLTTHPEIDIVGCNIKEFENNIDNIISFRKLPETHVEIERFAHYRCPVIQPSAMIRKKAAMRAGGYVEGRMAEDWDLYIRMLQTGSLFYNLQEVLLYVRISTNFFSRRGGTTMLKRLLHFKYKHYKTGFFSLPEFLIGSMATLFICCIPNSLRTYIYKHFLRN